MQCEVGVGVVCSVRSVKKNRLKLTEVPRGSCERPAILTAGSKTEWHTVDRASSPSQLETPVLHFVSAKRGGKRRMKN